MAYDLGALQAEPTPYTIESPWAPGSEAEALWCSVAAGGSIMVQRDCAFLQWRFHAGSRLFLARGAHGPLGYAAARIITRAGLKLGMLLDCVMVGHAANAVPLLRAVLAWLREQGALQLWDILYRTVRHGTKPALPDLSVCPAH